MDKEKLQYFLEQVSRLKINLKTNNYTKNTAASIYNLLPAFCEIYSNYTHELITTFPQILLFCNFCLKLITDEIQKFLHCGNSKNVSLNLILFFSCQTEDYYENKKIFLRNGDKLLESICILSKADTNMIDAMSRFRLATQMVRCLKIFINVDNTTYIDIPCAEKTYKSFSDILRRICHHQSTVNELLLSLAMKSLFDCFLIKKQDPRWREIAFDSILPILQNYMDSKLIDFISKNNVISHYLNQIVTLAEISEKSENIYIAAENLINLIVYMLNSSVQVDYAIITEFNSKFGYEIFISFIKSISEKEDDQSCRCMCSIFVIFEELIRIGYTDEISLKAAVENRAKYELTNLTAKNRDCFEMFQKIFLMINDDRALRCMLDVINHIFFSDNMNYFILEGHTFMVSIFSSLSKHSEIVQKAYFKILMGIMVSLKHIPVFEIAEISKVLVNEKNKSIVEMSLKYFKEHLIKNIKFRSSFRTYSIYLMILDDIFINNENNFNIAHYNVNLDLFTIVVDIASISVTDCKHNAEYVYTVYIKDKKIKKYKKQDARLIGYLLNFKIQIAASIENADLLKSTLIFNIQSSMNNLVDQTMTLETIRIVSSAYINALCNANTKKLFRYSYMFDTFFHIFDWIINLLNDLCIDKNNDQFEEIIPRILYTIFCIFSTFAAAIRNDLGNSYFFQQCNGYQKLTDIIVKLHFFQETDTTVRNEKIKPNSKKVQMIANTFNDVTSQGTNLHTYVFINILINFYYLMLDRFRRHSEYIQQFEPTKNQNWRVYLKNYMSFVQKGKDNLVYNTSASKHIIILIARANLSYDSRVSLYTYFFHIISNICIKKSNIERFVAVNLSETILLHFGYILFEPKNPVYTVFRSIVVKLLSLDFSENNLRFLLRSQLYDCIDSEFVKSLNSPHIHDIYTNRKITKPYGYLFINGHDYVSNILCNIFYDIIQQRRNYYDKDANLSFMYTVIDSSFDGKANIYLPSVAPKIVRPATSSFLGDDEHILLGGVGSEERVFPPIRGLSFSSWFMFVPDNSKSNIFNILNIEYINYLTNSAKFSKMIIDNSIPPFNAFSLNFNKMTYELTIATSHSKGNNNHPSDIVRYGAVFCCSNYIKPYAWNHLVIVFQKNQLSRYGDLLLYLNGAFVDKRKLRYIAPFPINSLTSVNAYIGNNVQKPFNGIPNDINIWKQGPVYLFEELLSADMVYDIYKMKQAYVGCFREYSSLNNTDLDSKIIFGLNNISNSFITLKAIRTIYNIYDSVLISSRIKLNSEDSTIPLFYLSNLAINTQGQSKSLGGFYIGNCGIYSVFSRSFHSSLVSCGGCKIFLALIAMSNSNDSFCSSIRLLRESLINNSVLLTDFSKNNGFQILAYIVKRKKQFITVNEVEMLFSLVTSNISDPNNIMIYNLRFFEDLLYDFDTWFSLKPFVTNYYFNLFEQLINCQQSGMQNHLKMKSINTLRRIFSHFLCSKFSISLLETLLSFLFVYLKNFTGHSTTISFCQFIISLVNLSVDENEIDRLEDSDEVKRKQTEIVHIRERCISLILRCITNSKQTELAIENFIMCAGFNFMFVLMNENIISTTRVLSLRLLVQICLSSLAYTRFIDKRLNGKCYDKNSLTFFGHKKLKSFFNDFPTKAEVTSVQSKISNVGGYNILHYITSYYENITPDFYFYLFHLSMQSSPGHFNEKKLTKSFLLSSKFNDHLFFDSIDTYKFWRLTPILLINLKIQTAGINYMLYTLYKEFGCTCTSHYSVLESACEIFSAYIETFKKSNCFVNFIMNHVFIQSLSFTLSFNTTNVFPFKHNSQCLFDVDEYEDVDKEYVFDNVLYAPIVFGIELMIGVLQSVFERLSLQESIAYVDSSLDMPKPESIRNLSLLKKYYETFFDKFINIIVQKGYWVKYKSSTVFSKLLSTKNMSSIISYISNKFVDLIVVQSIEISLDIVFDKICKLFIMYKSENLQIISSHDHKFNLYYAAQRLILYQLSKNILDNRIYNNVIQSLTQIYSYDFIILDEICIDKFYITFYFCLWKIITLCEEESHCLLLPNTYLLNLESSKKENLVQQCKTLFIQKETAIKSELNNFVCQKYLVSIDFENTNLVDLKLSDSIIKVLKNQKDMFRAINTVEKIEPDNKKPIQRKLFQTVFSNVKRISNKNIKIGSIVRHDNKINRYLEFFAFNPQAYCNELVIKQKFAHQWLSFQNKIIIEDAIQSIEHIKNEWKNKEYEMLRNGTIMGQTTNTNLEKYTRSEISVRLGMNFIKEHHCNFYEQYPFLANRKNSIKKMNRIPESFDSKIYFETYRFESFFPDEVSPRLIIFQQSEDEEIFKRKRVDTNSMNSIIQEAIQQKSLIISDENEKLLKEADDVDSDTEKGVHINDNASYTSSTSNVSEQQKKETKESVYTFERSSVVLTRILGTKERVSAIFRVSRINRLQKSDALLVFGIGRLYIIDGYTDFGDGSIVDINSIDPKSQEPIVPLAPSTENTSQIRENIIVKYKDILDCKKRRYILQRISLEIFISNGKVIFLVCCRKERNLVYNKICLKMKNRKNHYLRGIIKNEANLTDVTTQWENGEISNFDYLMYINIESGRTYNDLMQYPIFPWILSDYKSDTLNLNDPKSFRDLSKPMGAQDEIRLKKFKESREVLKEHYPEKSAYLYGTHYLSAAVVCNFLIRMEPFSICSITIQGNEFDTSDRLFKNISEAYSLASKLITHDVRELIPEFFYLPDYLINMNKFMFGQTQNGNLVDNVVLPKWAKEDPREFIRMHREALECDYVSANIHRWIDLIFGYCQRGKMAEEKDNVFHSLFYEGTVDIFSPEYKSDNLMLHSIIDFINNFGQIPSQLFVKPHVCKKLNMQRILVSTRMTNSLFSVDSDMPIKRIPIFYNYIHALHPSNDFIKKIKSPVGSIVTVKSQKTIYISVIGKNSLLLPPDYKYYIMWNQVDHSLKFLVLETDKVVFCAEHYNLINVTIAAATKKNTIILGTKSGLLHIAVILNIATAKMSIRFIKKLTLHTSKITCISISSDQNVFLTCDNDGKSIIWNLSKYTYVKKIQVCNQPISCCYINHTNGYIITATKTKIYVWDINGCFIVDTTLDSPHTYINCIKMSQMYNWNNKNVIMAGCSDGIVRMWSIRHRKRLSLPSKIVSRGNSVNSEETQFCQAFPSNTDILISYEDYEEKSSVVTWECYLKLRGTLTKFTSYKRPDNHQPASITTISITLDHKMILIGDSLGRVFCWEVPSSSPSTTTDVWVDDDFCDSCSDCLIKFTAKTRRHHCRSCGNLYCSNCSSHVAIIKKLNSDELMRVCLNCFKKFN